MLENVLVRALLPLRIIPSNQARPDQPIAIEFGHLVHSVGRQAPNHVQCSASPQQHRQSP